MKHTWKYVNAGCFFVALMLGFVTLIEAITLRVSMFGIVKMGFGGTDGMSIFGDLYSQLQSYIRPASVFAIILFLFLILGLILSLVLKRGSYVWSMILALVHMFGIAFFYFALWQGLDQVKGALAWLGMSGIIELKKFPLIMWLFLDIAIVTFSIIGLASTGKKQQMMPRGTMMAPQYQGMPVQNVQNMQYHPVQNQMRQPQPMPQPVPVPQPVPQPISRPVSSAPQQGTDSEIKEMTAEEWKQELKTMQMPSQGVPKNVEDLTEYAGEIHGNDTELAEGVYEMREEESVYLAEEGENILLEDQPSERTLAVVTYRKNGQIYCVEPAKPGMVFLKSGQPLGAHREYALPRGIEIYLKSEDHNFKLV